ncbi:MAG: hypothetical protein NVSMB9_11760 [Isosphaeraceae bacterium]
MGLDLGARPEAAGFAPWLVLWVSLTILLQGVIWLAGFRNAELSAAVDRGAARSEALWVGEVGDDLIRKAIHTQHETLPFWTVLAFLGDFLVEPLLLMARAVGAATAFSAVAALWGRGVEFDRSLAGCATAQGIWVLGLASRVALMLALRSGAVETSAALLLPSGTYPAPVWLGLRQLDVFTLIGWSSLALGGVRRGQVAWPGAIAITAGLGLTEASLHVGAGWLMGSAMRLALSTS